MMFLNPVNAEKITTTVFVCVSIGLLKFIEVLLVGTNLNTLLPVVPADRYEPPPGLIVSDTDAGVPRAIFVKVLPVPG